MQLDLFEQFSTSRNAGLELHELFDAYTECRGNKRNTANALAFEMDYAKPDLIALWRDIR
ncbi:MAG: hypothetical protein EPN89_04365 [Methylovulum sp.]|nr:MAG: hypothetical protein EPN89_04365 [Methylovulum sp.]